MEAGSAPFSPPLPSLCQCFVLRVFFCLQNSELMALRIIVLDEELLAGEEAEGQIGWLPNFNQSSFSYLEFFTQPLC